jgi:acyl-CoA reductase-like NAD-dependent aldehyde dehydrogenase
MSLTTNAIVRAINPRTGATVGEYPASTPAEYEHALQQAARCAADPRMEDSARRAAGLRGAATRLRNQVDAIVETALQETGLPAGRLRGELERTCLQLEMFASVIDAGEHLEPIIDSADADAQPAPRPDLRRQLISIGPVAVFGASNFPLAFSTAGGDTASALAAGCPVVVKGHPAHPGTASIVAGELSSGLTEAGLPDGAFTQLTSADVSLGEQLVSDPRIRAVAFTGSLAVGREISRRAAERETPIPVFAEMGSLNPLIVTPQAAAARGAQIADGLATSVATFGGQLCTKPGLAFVSDDDAGHALVDALAAALSDHGPEILLTHAIHERFEQGVGEVASASGVTQLIETTQEPNTAAKSSPRLFSAPLDVLTSVGALREEHFGPALIVLFYRELDGVAPALEGLGGQLSITLHSQPDEHGSLRELVARMTRLCGRLVFDGYPTGVSVCWSMEHGGPYPATSAESTTSVGVTAFRRFLRPVVLQNAPPAFVPPSLADGNPRGLSRRVDGILREA